MIRRKRAAAPRPATRGVSLLLVVLLVVLAGHTLPRSQGRAGGGATAEGGGESLPIYLPGEERVEARIVLVPVTVTRRRAPVLDLSAEDFELKVDGELHPIASFDAPLITAAEHADATSRGGREPDAAAPQHSPADGAPPAASANVAVVLDLYQTDLARMTSGFSATRQFLATGVPPATRVGLFMISRAEMHRVVGFTDDVDLLRRELDALEKRTDLRDTWISGENERQAEVEAYVGNASNRVSSQDQDAGLRATLPRAESAVRSYAVEQSQRVRRFLRSLEVLVAAMSDLPGRKGVILVGDGVREQAGLNYTRGIRQLFDETHDMRVDFRRTLDLFKSTGITLSPVSLIGLYIHRKNDPDALESIFGTLQTMARQTGGRRTVALNDFSGEVVESAYQPAASYILGFRPPAIGPDGTRHSIQVRVRRPGVKVAARTEYVDRDKTLDDATRTAAAVLMPERFTALPLGPTVHLMPGHERAARVHVQVSIPTRAVRWVRGRPGRREGRLELQGLLRDSTGRVKELFRSIYDLDVHAVDPPERIVIQEQADIEIPRDSEVLLIAVDRVSSGVAAATLAVSAWEPETKKVSVSRPVLLPEVSGVYFLAAGGEPRLGLRLGTRLFLPAERPPSADRPVLALARVSGMPDAGRVRFCLDPQSCVDGRLNRVGHTGQVSAWLALDGETARRVNNLAVEVVDAEGATVARVGPD